MISKVSWPSPTSRLGKYTSVQGASSFFLFHSINSKVIQFKSYCIKSISFFQITTNQSWFFCVYIFISPFVFLCLLPLCISQVSMIQSLVNFVFLCFPLCIFEVSLILSIFSSFCISLFFALYFRDIFDSIFTSLFCISLPFSALYFRGLYDSIPRASSS